MEPPEMVGKIFSEMTLSFSNLSDIPYWLCTIRSPFLWSPLSFPRKWESNNKSLRNQMVFRIPVSAGMKGIIGKFRVLIVDNQVYLFKRLSAWIYASNCLSVCCTRHRFCIIQLYQFRNLPNTMYWLKSKPFLGSDIFEADGFFFSQ